MSLYAINQRVWVKSERSLGLIREANYLKNSNGRRAQYLVQLVTGTQTFANGKPCHVPVTPYHELLTGSSNLRAADWSCDGCDRWLSGHPHRTAPDGEYPNGLGFCFLCIVESERQSECQPW